MGLSDREPRRPRNTEQTRGKRERMICTSSNGLGLHTYWSRTLAKKDEFPDFQGDVSYAQKAGAVAFVFRMMVTPVGQAVGVTEVSKVKKRTAEVNQHRRTEHQISYKT